MQQQWQQQQQQQQQLTSSNCQTIGRTSFGTPDHAKRFNSPFNQLLSVHESCSNVPRSTPPPFSALPFSTLPNFSRFRSVLTLRCLLTASFRLAGTLLDTLASGDAYASDEVGREAVGVTGLRNGKVELGLVAREEVGVEGMDIESDCKSCSGSAC